MGYLVMPSEIDEFDSIKKAVSGAARVLSYVNTPTMFQLLMKKCHEDVADMSIYRKNRDLLYGALTDLGFSCVKPDGAFYLFPKSLEPDDYAFCKKAVEHNLILVPGTEFGCPQHVRISYCVSTEQIERALPAFETLAKEYGRG